MAIPITIAIALTAAFASDVLFVFSRDAAFILVVFPR
jgi:hypothetical protein